MDLKEYFSSSSCRGWITVRIIIHANIKTKELYLVTAPPPSTMQAWHHHLSPGSVCLGDGWPLLQHLETSVDSTAFCSEPGRRDGIWPPPRPAHLHPGARRSAGAASREWIVTMKQGRKKRVKQVDWRCSVTHVNQIPGDVCHPLSTVPASYKQTN